MMMLLLLVSAAWWAPNRDGTSMVVTDEVGQIYMFGMGDLEQFRGVPMDQFFLGDYRAFTTDMQHNTLDQVRPPQPNSLDQVRAAACWQARLMGIQQNSSLVLFSPGLPSPLALMPVLLSLGLVLCGLQETNLTTHERNILEPMCDASKAPFPCSIRPPCSLLLPASTHGQELLPLVPASMHSSCMCFGRPALGFLPHCSCL